MKTCFGLFVFLLSLFVHSRSRMSDSTNGVLLLRGRVPASTSIDWDQNDQNSIPKFRFNGSKIKPKVEITSKKNQRNITIIHP